MNRSLVLYDDLARAVEVETVKAICYWWGVSDATVCHWRKVLKVPAINAGTLKVKQDTIRKHGAKIRAAIDYSDLARREKIAWEGGPLRPVARGQQPKMNSVAGCRQRKLLPEPAGQSEQFLVVGQRYEGRPADDS